MPTQQNYLSSSPKKTQELAANLANSLTTRSIITLEGEMGAGKTTFAQGFGQAFGIKRMTSPTYTFIKEYPLNSDLLPLFTALYHIDLYRIGSTQEALDLGLEELWKDSRNILLVEWPDTIKDVLPKHIQVTIKQLDKDQRQITIQQ